ncbi:hypothetical protein K814_0119660 [Pseudomonas fluorescens LMG 5329]|uniref:Uncharacterized protein n=1 Tax=Pseudomonas fluorescens LMG 5329 TaxID=1324332 RepID=A0A0A1YWI3_PSEFL|nr:hypothetical protein K814_0119660 [Pseudomonas fluorescens LMG 5329]
MPASAVFHGYVVHIPSADEFLLEFVDSDAATSRLFTNSPSQAQRFHEFEEAYHLIRKDKGEIVSGLFETENQYLISQVA